MEHYPTSAQNKPIIGNMRTINGMDKKFAEKTVVKTVVNMYIPSQALHRGGVWTVAARVGTVAARVKLRQLRA